ncbi:hypothetical protein DFR50_12069 [Roseiarcus fermentans]|uniref:Anti-sigma factor NepR domain-containing protein n=1 Tax=Roseiarcus fermentans TaxID=1473586 RepID=A0A366F7X7_9HYPH|nr:NepR family anti-sigma factor [Roseiarcus fermentans]RBP09869.1 hypothetical protein DFR50_12069 [Roseiarcus fermentans]
MTKLTASKHPSSVEAPTNATPLDAIGRALRAHYDDLLREPLPAQFEALLSRLEAGEIPAESRDRARPKA